MDSISPQLISKTTSDNTFEVSKPHLDVREEGRLVSNSTANSVIQNQSNAASVHGDNESCSSPQTEVKREPVADLYRCAETYSAWGKPLKKVEKQEESSGKYGGINTAVVKIVKPGVPSKKSSRPEFKNSPKKSDRSSPKTKQPLYESVNILPSKNTSQKPESTIAMTDVYKFAISKRGITEEQLQEEISKKLSCSASGTNIFESSKLNLGYPAYIEKDIFKKLKPMPIMKLLSYKAFFDSPSRMADDHWIPAYINETHFKRNYDDILDAIALICQDIERTDGNQNFEPLMVLKVLPTLLVKTTIHFSKRNISQSKDSIDTFCQLYRLFVKLVELFPEIREAIDEEAKSFLSSESDRSQKVHEDLGEFLIKLSVSSEGLNNSDLINLVLQEHLVRQAVTSLRKNRDLGKGEHECDKFLERYMDTIHNSNEVLLSIIEICRLFADKEVKREIELKSGVLNGGIRRVFLERLGWIHRNVGHDWRALIKVLKLESFVSNEQGMASYVVKSFETAKSSGYFKY